MNGTYLSNGARLVYRDTGAGLPVVFLHPTPVDHVFWLPVVGRLKGIRAIIPDLRGHGASELGSNLPVGGFARVPGAPVLTMAQLADDVIALLDHLGLAHAAFVGCSIGGYVELELWRKAPQRIRGMGFICSKPQPDGEPALVRRAEMITKALGGGTEALFDGMALNLIGATARAKRPEIVAELRACMTLTEEAEIAVQAGLGSRPDSVPTVGTIEVPILAIAGGEDVSVTPDEMRAFCSRSAGQTDYKVLPENGHFAAYENPDAVASFVGEWLRQFSA